MVLKANCLLMEKKSYFAATEFLMVAKQRKIQALTKNKSLLIYTLRKTFFDRIEENIQYPRLLVRAFVMRSELIKRDLEPPPSLSAVSVANGKIILTSQSTKFTLFSLGDNDWTESFVEFPGNFSMFPLYKEQLLTVRSQESKR